MTQRQIEDLLSEHADRLIAAEAGGGGHRGGEPSRVEPAGLSAEDQRSVSDLFQLARRVQAALVEVEPRPAFVSDLKARLVAQRRAEAQPQAEGGPGMLWVAGVAGALSMAGVGFLTYWAARTGAGWISSAVANRSARPALHKA